MFVEALVAAGDSSTSGTAARTYERGVIGEVPIPRRLQEVTPLLTAASNVCIAEARLRDSLSETSRLFAVGSLKKYHSIRDLANDRVSFRESTVINITRAFEPVEQIAEDLYELDRKDLMMMDQEIGEVIVAESECSITDASLAVAFSMDEQEVISRLKDSGATSRGVTAKYFLADRKLELLSLLYRIPLSKLIEGRRRLGILSSEDVEVPTSDLVCLSFGFAFGRWDIRYATGEKAAPELPDPFAPLPVCPPGMLQNAQGLPANPEDVPTSYPLKNIPWDGILVDDPHHPLDIEHRIREVIEIIWSGKEGGPNAEAIEHEACEILGIKSLRDYFRKPAGFFADHLKRYSKSRRQAPIYWPLSTKSSSYTLWIYYHRLTDQTLHTCLIDFVIPKLKTIENEIGNLRESKITGERLESLLELQQEMCDFKAELEEIIKLPWKPNLNDGVLINAAPLWKLFRLPAWQKKLKTTWDELTKGDYDWAHLAYTIWPERVKEACKTDRSMAIAHGLEHLCTIQAPKAKAKAKRKGKASDEDEAELDLFGNDPEIEEAEESTNIPPKGRKSTAKKPNTGKKITRPRGRPAKTPKSDNPLGDK